MVLFTRLHPGWKAKFFFRETLAIVCHNIQHWLETAAGSAQWTDRTPTKLKGIQRGVVGTVVLAAALWWVLWNKKRLFVFCECVGFFFLRVLTFWLIYRLYSTYEGISQKYKPLTRYKRMQRAEVRKQSKFCFIEQGNFLLLKWSVNSGRISFLWSKPEAGTFWAPRAADHTPLNNDLNKLRANNIDNVAPFARTESLGWW